MTSDATQTGQVAAGTGSETGNGTADLRELIARAKVVLWDFDGPICRLFAGHPAKGVADGLVEWLEGRGLRGLLRESERESPDPQVVLRAVYRRHPGSDLLAELEKRLTQEELKATSTAMPTAWADPLIRTLAALKLRLAITTNNSPQAAATYLAGRGLASCFAPHIYGRTRELRLLKPDPYCLNRALSAMGSAPGTALMIGDAPSDFEAAGEAGVPFLGYARNERKEKLLREAGATTVVGSLEPLLNAVRSGGSEQQ
ncbi:HAD family hydrolase [Streptomyces rishiriensis]|uniref:HAD superfamily hydrolase (TIGR01509 family) n=1 Tax=Streptomyces rishiriensis TaxID=68264 RepID=A0ABU0NS00_STRRH|nr:HAD family hydrolase [Streptomyces rishiriensis]MDQ0581876.1 HAD superfamily hydrolase (TIGR01509 family) [Streptomyces rishiriensis]